MEKSPANSPYILHLDGGFYFIKQRRNEMNFINSFLKMIKGSILTVRSGYRALPASHQCRSGAIWVTTMVNVLLNFPKRRQLGPFFFFFFLSILFPCQNNRPIARTRMKGRLLPNLEVHRSLQAPNRGCSRNPETEQASGHCQGPHGTWGHRISLHIPEVVALKHPQCIKRIR